MSNLTGTIQNNSLEVVVAEEIILIGAVQSNLEVKGTIANSSLEINAKVNALNIQGSIIAGARGKSAYQIWLEEGNVGTESDFLNWLGGVNAEWLTIGDGLDGELYTGGAPVTISHSLLTVPYEPVVNPEVVLNSIQILNVLDVDDKGHLRAASYKNLVAGSNVIITAAEDGSITISSTGGGGGVLEPDFVTTDKFTDTNYIYFIGDTVTGWAVNRYDIGNIKTTSSGTVNRPTSLVDCQGLIYE